MLFAFIFSSIDFELPIKIIFKIPVILTCNLKIYRTQIKLFDLLNDYFKVSSNSLAPIAVHSATDNIVNEIRGGFQACKADIIDINREKRDKEAEIQQLSVEADLSRVS